MTRYALTIFLSAFLLFQVQPLIAKSILPWFGGGPAVWTTCLLFFQVALLAGYGYAHLVTTRLNLRGQVALHSALLLAALLFLPIVPDPSWKASGSEEPVGRILGLLGATVGVPFLLLSTTAPLLQRWFSHTHLGHSPYRLYALSNAGSLLALLTYPVAVEPYSALRTQAWVWSFGFWMFAAGCAYCAWKAREVGEGAPKGGSASDSVEASPEGDHAVGGPGLVEKAAAGAGRLRTADVLPWLGLSMFPSVLLLATTHQISQEVSVVPFLWVLPLSLYLLSFILCFENDRWYRRFPFGVLLQLAVAGACFGLYRGVGLPLLGQIAVFSAALFLCCMTCHGELARSKPPAHRLTAFYCAVAAGGALGGVFVVCVAPHVFDKFWELHLGLLGCVLLTYLSYARDRTCRLHGWRPRWAWGLLLLFPVGFTIALGIQAATEEGEVVARARNFFGLLTVYRQADAEGHAFYSLDHGRIRHGIQYVDPDKRARHTSYYHPDTGVALALRFHPKREGFGSADRSLKIGVIGLGAGTLANHARRGDEIRFYEINPEVVRLANEYFTYCRDTRAKVSIVLGDGRIQLERELAAQTPRRFDVLAVDAFSGDAVPMHLLTREAFELYWKHLNPEGILAYQTTNLFLDLKPVVRGLAEAAGYKALWVSWNARGRPGFENNTWVLVTRNRGFIETKAVRRRTRSWSECSKPNLVWTDDYGSLFQVLGTGD